MRTPRAAAGALLVSAAGLLLSGCGLEPSTAYIPAAEPGSIPVVEGAEDTEVRVTSKNFTEQLILGKIAVLAVEAAGFETEDITNVPGSQPVRELMLAGDADLTFEYTGTAWLTYLGKETGIPDQQEQWRAVREADLANGLTWGEPAALNNTYAMAVRSEYAQANGLETVSDIARLPVAERTFCVESEFNSRSDGLTPLLAHYGLDRGSEVPEDNIGIYDTGAIYSATDAGECNFGEVFSTDGRIPALDLTVLEDDRQFFPAYNAAPVYSSQLLAEHPGLEDVMEPIAAALTDDVMQELNRQVDVEGRDPADVAYEWMVAEGFLVEP
ncbi:glycine betaine ABC transporter substrate-binding protein [Kocuria sp. LUK]|uniref:Glycine/betaine ABC transporter substrate-binding protein n=1 Tax=Kocuria flava TaxID=446860 RepID=A0A2N4SYE4_9MICC|nr:MULTISPECIES: glycine betaine ABC transporter substrate-binding protein [Kocuria]MCD1145941.1 glycine betaine ABC transporter substrate-binding protein [Kocuria sp. LUK]PLC11002.1 glycine/betaine ABC transporter substrate-binding protein [Kocuria flava]